MKSYFLFLCLISSILIFAQNPNYENWKNLSKENINLQPEYGNTVKTQEQIQIDNEFTEDILRHYKTKEAGSSEMVNLGMYYLYSKGDFETAMKRFNQAYLLNKNNPDVYYGYGPFSLISALLMKPRFIMKKV